MGGLNSKTRRSGNLSPLLQAKTSFQLTADFSSYEDACKEDGKLQSFDVTLQGRTNHVIKSLNDGVEIRSLGSFKEVTNCLLEMNQYVVKVILESKEDIWNNPELFGLVEEYFKSSVKTMEFCTALGSSLERAQNSQLILQLAINQFEEEVEKQDGEVQNKFVKTLEALQKFKAAGDPFTPQFFALFESVYKQQVSMLKKLLSRKKKLDEKLKSMETWRRVSNVLFEARTFVTIKDMVNIRVLVSKLQGEIESLLHNADVAIREEDAVKLVIDVIKRKMAVLMESIEDLTAHAGKCHDDIIAARRVILNRILISGDK